MKKCVEVFALWLLVAFQAFAQTPTPVVERISTHNENSTRVSLFSNRVIVVTMTHEGEQTMVRLLTLPENQYMTYLGVLIENSNQLKEKPTSSSVDTSRSTIQIFLHVGPDSPRLLRFSPMSSVSLPLSRIMGALDDLQRLVLESSPSTEELRNWEPQRFDRVQLFNNSFATVIEVRDDGTLVLEHEDTWIRELVPQKFRDQVILHVVGLEP